MNPITPAANPPKNAAAKPPAPEVENEFAVILSQHDRGSSLTELSSTLHDLVMAVRATGKKGKIKYTLEVNPVKNTEGKRIELNDDIQVTLPKPSRRPSTFFTTEDGHLTRRDPDQVDWIEEEQKRAAATKDESVRLTNRITKDDLAAATGR